MEGFFCPPFPREYPDWRMGMAARHRGAFKSSHGFRALLYTPLLFDSLALRAISNRPPLERGFSFPPYQTQTLGFSSTSISSASLVPGFG
jgi:hypothetical protein